MSKNDYRSFFADIAPFIKINYFLKDCGISQPAFSRFMKDELFNYQVSIENLHLLYNRVKVQLEKFV